MCFLLLELGLRIFTDKAFDYSTVAADESVIWQYDAELGWSMQPHGEAKFSRPEFSSRIRTNALGLRDDELAATKNENEIRILLIGDSVVAGFEVQRQQTLEFQLQTLLQQRFPEKKIEVINAGVRGYGTDQELLYLIKRGLALHPDVVVLGFVPANDLENNVTVHTAGRIFSKPYFELGIDGELKLQGVPVPDNPEQQQIYSPVLPTMTELQPDKNAGHQQSWKVWMSKHFYLYGFVARRLKSASPKLIGLLKKFGILHNPLPREQVDFYRAPMSENWQARWKITLALIKKMQETCAEQNIEFLLWSFPLKEQIYARDREIFLRSFAVSENELDFQLPDKKLAEFTAALRIRFVMTDTTFSRLAKTGKRFHFLTDHHFNAQGHRLIAELLAPVVAEKCLGAFNGQNESLPRSPF